jgi:hypothetical protein
MDDAINSFNAVTGNEKLEVAKFYLDMVRGDVEQAIVAFMESGGAEPAADDTEEVDAELPDEDFQKPSDAKITTDSGKKDDEQRYSPSTAAQACILVHAEVLVNISMA